MTLILPDRLQIAEDNRIDPGEILLHSSGDNTRSHTGDAVKTILETVTVPGGIMGANGFLTVEYLLEADATTSNTFVGYVYVDGSASGDRLSQITSRYAIHWNKRILVNQNSTQVQKGVNLFSGFHNSLTSSAAANFTVDTENDFDIDFAVQLNAADAARTLSFAWTCVKIWQAP